MAAILRYVNTNSTAGGDGTTDATSGVNRAYSSQNEMEAAEQTDLVAAGDTFTGICAGGLDSGVTSYSGWTTGASNDILITTTIDRHSGVFDTAKYYMDIGTSASVPISIVEEYMSIVGLQFLRDSLASSSGARPCISISGVNTGVTTVTHSIFKSIASPIVGVVSGIAINDSQIDYQINNNIFYDFTGGTHKGISNTAGSPTGDVYNNTFINCTEGFSSKSGMTAKNNIFQDCTTDIGGTAGAGNDYNLTDNVSIAGANSVTSSTLTFISKAKNSYALAVGDTDAIGAGIGPSSDANVPLDDIIGTVRSGATTDIGAFVRSDNYVLCVNSGVTYADITAADAAEGGTDYGVPTRFEQTGVSSSAVVFSNTDYPSSLIYIATSGEETDGTTGTGAQCTGLITTSVTNGVIQDLRTGRITFSSAVGHANVNLVSDGGGGDVYLFAANAASSTNCIRYNCSEGCRATSTNDNYIETNCTVVDATGFGVLRPRAVDSVSLNTSSSAYLQVGASSSNYWADDGTGSNAITETTKTDIFENYATGDYRIKPTSSVGVAGAGAFINSSGSGISIGVTEAGPSFTESINTNLSVNITGAIVENGPAFTEAVNVTLTSLTLQANITESGPPFTESITSNLGVNITSVITELGPSFTESININVIGDRVASIVESGPSFVESIIASIPITITVNPKNIIRVKRKDNTVIIKRKSNIIRVR